MKTKKKKRIRFCGCTCLFSGKKYKVACNRIWQRERDKCLDVDFCRKKKVGLCMREIGSTCRVGGVVVKARVGNC